ncbi:hypothetical protein BJ322DRAFT_1022552 [Thelephora terrestris]|uniref:Uncharacterized protein n=1 Tax=Thelephora terrestris TaxID=56493 RepID=A0A9P6L4L4_9AGAM|nr:hypothetical protein BJ322DRAFT_1022552 [Thelephora terrestris]
MGACTFEFTKNSPLRMTLVDEATDHAKYQIETPIRIVGSVSRIRKFDLPPQAPLIRDDKASSDHSDDPSDKGKKKRSKWRIAGRKLSETDDEIARIHWKCLSPSRERVLAKDWEDENVRKPSLSFLSWSKAELGLTMKGFSGQKSTSFFWHTGSAMEKDELE